MGIWNTILYQPLYNALIYLVDVLPGGSLALAIIGLTILVKIILLPLSKKALRNQLTQKRLQPYIQKIRARFTDRKEQSVKLMEFYKLNKTNPFSGCLLVIVQLPIILALYRTFLQGVDIQPELLYSFVHIPEQLNTIYLGGIIDLQETSIILAVATGIVQLIQVRYSPAFKTDPETEKQEKENSKKISEMESQDEVQALVMKKIQKGMRYLVPVMITGFAMFVPSAVALYWMVSNMFTIAQELAITRGMKTPPVVMPEGYDE